MILKMFIPDEQVQELQETLHTADPDAVLKEIRRRVAALSLTKPGDRILLILPDDRRRLEAVFQVPIQTAEQLIDRVKRLSAVQIGPVTRHFTHDEVMRLQEQARFHGWSAEDYALLVANEVLDRMMDRW